MSQIVCLYHHDCPDGLGSAWALTKRFPDAECIAVKYNQPVPQRLLGKIVYIVDFCYPLDELVALSAIAQEVHVFDHHKGMEDTVDQYNAFVHAMGWDETRFRAVFDQKRSGAKLTWELLLPEYPTPQIIEHISDRDLWKFELDETEAVMAGLGTYEMSLKSWDQLFRWDPSFHPEDNGHAHWAAVDSFEFDGYVVLRKMRMDIERLVELSLRTVVLAGEEVPLINIPRTLVSETLAQLAINQSFAVGYFDTAHHREFSLRSSKEGADVSAVARQYGGNGHTHAAGFKVSRDHPLAQI